MIALGLSPEQIELRRRYVQAGDAAKIMAGEWRQVWREKKGLAAPEDLSGNLAVQMGSFTEPFGLAWYMKQTGRAVEYHTDNMLMAEIWGFLTDGGATTSELVVSKRYPWMACNLDARSTTSKGKRCVLDQKHVGKFDTQTILRYTAASVHQSIVCDVDHWALSVFIGNSKWELYEAEVDPFYAERLIEMEREFWGYVERGEEPEDRTEPVPAPKPQPALRTVVIDGGTVDGEGFWSAPQDDKHQSWPNWGPSFAKDLATVIRTQGAATANAIARKNIKELVPSDVGEIRRGDTVVKRDKAGALRFTLPGGESDE